ncbi:MAG: hypothetical protein JKY60_16425 [Kordiimonadaceae bacterium]|nr:hypothetical protein [Kordiimonadaceae bacterium]
MSVLIETVAPFCDSEKENMTFPVACGLGGFLAFKKIAAYPHKGQHAKCRFVDW